jgi:hypothetical protein
LSSIYKNVEGILAPEPQITIVKQAQLQNKIQFQSGQKNATGKENDSQERRRKINCQKEPNLIIGKYLFLTINKKKISCQKKRKKID